VNLASGSLKVINIWNGFTLKKNVTGHSNLIYSLAVLDNGYLASGSGDKKN
jgi:hypothetical protein